jgi:hypothetical protein
MGLLLLCLGVSLFAAYEHKALVKAKAEISTLTSDYANLKASQEKQTKSCEVTQTIDLNNVKAKQTISDKATEAKATLAGIKEPAFNKPIQVNNNESKEPVPGSLSDADTEFQRLLNSAYQTAKPGTNNSK